MDPVVTCAVVGAAEAVAAVVGAAVEGVAVVGAAVEGVAVEDAGVRMGSDIIHSKGRSEHARLRERQVSTIPSLRLYEQDQVQRVVQRHLHLSATWLPGGPAPYLALPV